MNWSLQVPHPTKRACAGNARILKEEDHLPANTCIPTEVSKLDPVKRPPVRYVDFGPAELMSHAGGGFGQEGQDDKEEEIARWDYKDEGDGITDEAKDGPLNDDEVNGQKTTDSHLEARRQQRTIKSFEHRIKELEAFKAKHGHVNVTVKHDKSLYGFCANVRTARRGRSSRPIAEDRIKALDELGFTWEDTNKSFEERIEELEALKEKHGHVRATLKHDKSLHGFCAKVRSARRGTGAPKVFTEDQIKALDELGFAWVTRTSRLRDA